jgi:hypothetical protein
MVGEEEGLEGDCRPARRTFFERGRTTYYERDETERLTQNRSYPTTPRWFTCGIQWRERVRP